jgi:uncharacterized protein YpmB
MIAAIFLAIFIAMIVAIFFSLALTGTQWKEAQERARTRRMAEHSMNARLVRLNV